MLKKKKKHKKGGIVGSLQEQIDALIIQVDSIESQALEAFSIMVGTQLVQDNKIISLNSTITALEADFEDLDGTLGHLESEIDSMESDALEAYSQILAVQNEQNYNIGALNATTSDIVNYLKAKPTSVYYQVVTTNVTAVSGEMSSFSETCNRIDDIAISGGLVVLGNDRHSTVNLHASYPVESAWFYEFYNPHEEDNYLNLTTTCVTFD